MVSFLRGQVRLAHIDLAIPRTVYGQASGHLVLILSNDQFNKRTSLAMVLPIDSEEINRDHFDSMRIGPVDGIPDPAWVMLDQIRTMPTSRLGECVGTVKLDEMQLVLKNLFARMI